MFKIKKQKSKTRYEHVQFTSKLKQARTRKRVIYSPTWQKILAIFNLLLRFWKLILGLCIVFVLGILLVFYKPLFHVVQVEVVGGETSLQLSVKQDIEDFLATRHWLLPQANILLLSEMGLRKYILEHNKLVYKIDKVEKKYPKSLIVSITERAQTFVYYTQDKQAVYIANDGTVLETTEVRPDILPISWPGEHPISPGSQFLNGQLLSTLLSIHNNFQEYTGLAKPSLAEIVPVSVNTLAKENFDENVPNSLSDLVRPTILPLADVPPQEIFVHIGKNSQAGMSAFYILFDVDNNTNESLENLKQLLLAQSRERLANLAYIDMRFNNKAFICLRSAPCATRSINIP